MFDESKFANKIYENEAVKNNSEDFEDISKPNIEEISLSNLSFEDLSSIKEVVEMLDDISSRSYQDSENFKKKTEIFIEEVSKAYSKDQLKGTALFHILNSTGIPDNVENLDLEGDYSIRGFLQETLNQLEEES